MMRRPDVSFRHRYSWLGGLALFLAGSAAYGNNGAIAYAPPVDDIIVDGDLSDWLDVPRLAIERQVGSQPFGAGDFSATFAVAYNLQKQTLYVAVEVIDDSHIVDSSDTADWSNHDTHLLYVDRQHLPGGSGGVLYIAGDTFRGLSKPKDAWDPANAGASWDDIGVVVKNRGLRTVYEWKLPLGDDIQPNKTLGIDHLLVDVDDDEEGEETLLFWGDSLGKSTNSYRLGDVVLMDPAVRLGRLEGAVRWQSSLEDAPLSLVRITAVDRSDLWTQAHIDETGRYAVLLPPGDYRVSSPYRLTKPFRDDFNNLPLRIDDSLSVQAHVEPLRVADAGDLILPTLSPPETLFRDKGLLLDFDDSKATILSDFVRAYTHYYDIPGVSLVIVKDGQVAYHQAFGVRNTLTRQPVQDSTLFEAASITKAVFAFAVMRLAEKGIVDLDAPLWATLPFPNISGDPRSRKLTARMVLSHRTGLPNWAWGGPGGWENGGDLELEFEPGTRFQYSGEAFNYLGRVLEEITGKGLEAILREQVLEPFNMTNTYFSLNEEQARTASIGHFHYLPVWRERATSASPASSMHTEALDFSRFMIGLIQKQGLAPETYQEMFTIHSPIPRQERLYDDPWEQNVGLGFFLEDTPWGQLVGHGGNNGDFDCKFGVIPERGIGYAAFTNGNVGDELLRALEIFLLQGLNREDSKTPGVAISNDEPEAKLDN